MQQSLALKHKEDTWVPYWVSGKTFQYFRYQHWDNNLIADSGNLRVTEVMRGCHGEFEGNRSVEGVSWEASSLEFTIQQQKSKLKTKVILNFFKPTMLFLYFVHQAFVFMSIGHWGFTEGDWVLALLELAWSAMKWQHREGQVKVWVFL